MLTEEAMSLKRISNPYWKVRVTATVAIILIVIGACYG